jgi:hypothetical protein
MSMTASFLVMSTDAQRGERSFALAAVIIEEALLRPHHCRS